MVRTDDEQPIPPELVVGVEALVEGEARYALFVTPISWRRRVAQETLALVEVEPRDAVTG